jgi:hypothetical protein
MSAWNAREKTGPGTGGAAPGAHGGRPNGGGGARALLLLVAMISFSILFTEIS